MGDVNKCFAKFYLHKKATDHLRRGESSHCASRPAPGDEFEIAKFGQLVTTDWFPRTGIVPIKTIYRT